MRDKGGILGFGILSNNGLGILKRIEAGNVLEFQIDPASPNNAEEIAAFFNKKYKIQEYRSYLTDIDKWGISITAQKEHVMFALKNPEDHLKLDVFVKSIRYGGWQLIDAKADGKKVILTRNAPRNP